MGGPVWVVFSDILPTKHIRENLYSNLNGKLSSRLLKLPTEKKYRISFYSYYGTNISQWCHLRIILFNYCKLYICF